VVEVKRKERESLESLLRRFNRHIIQSGTIDNVKQHMFHQKKETKRQNRNSAQYRSLVRGQREELRRTGKLDKMNPQKLKRYLQLSITKKLK
jgi:ribosomal protein S21